MHTTRVAAFLLAILTGLARHGLAVENPPSMLAPLPGRKRSGHRAGRAVRASLVRYDEPGPGRSRRGCRLARRLAQRRSAFLVPLPRRAVGPGYGPLDVNPVRPGVRGWRGAAGALLDRARRGAHGAVQHPAFLAGAGRRMARLLRQRGPDRNRPHRRRRGARLPDAAPPAREDLHRPRYQRRATACPTT